jgi:multisubunit Na+/H+ antiporter MnhE subunit
MPNNLSEPGQLILGSIMGAGALVICRKAGLDPLSKETAVKAWAVFVGFAIVFVLASNVISGGV